MEKPECSEPALSIVELDEMFPWGKISILGMPTPWDDRFTVPSIVMNWEPAYVIWGAN